MFKKKRKSINGSIFPKPFQAAVSLLSFPKKIILKTEYYFFSFSVKKFLNHRYNALRKPKKRTAFLTLPFVFPLISIVSFPYPLF